MRKKTFYESKLKQATHTLFFKHHRKPGAKGWELRKNLGSNYPKILALLNRHLEKLDLQVKTVFEEEKPPEKPTMAELDKARFYITLRGALTPKETKMMGWRIDDIAGLAITISTIVARKGRAQRKDVEAILRDKLPDWRTNINLDRYIRSGYIDEDDKGQLYLDWRTRAEIDEKILLDLVMAK
ncbi:MAG: hypothetical protein JSV64_05095 [Candidatus Bathyarchaeota archaeon]|nr:MAG: hypothetical protein JSV64_05095 [Candidatus Bathyarchaeota archaeon]